MVVVAWFHIPTLLEIGENDPLFGEDLLRRETEPGNLIFQDIDQVDPVLSVDEAVMKDAHVLVEPQFYDAEGFATELVGG